MPDESIPDYEPRLASYHDAFDQELTSMMDSLPIHEGDLVLDVACGDGAYTPRLAAKVGRSGVVIGLDVSSGYLRIARGHSSRGEHASRSRFVAASLDRLPFAEGSFDAVWCAQSLFSLPEPVDAVTRMSRMVKPGGLVAVLEDDTLHQILLPWPVEVELAIRVAEWEAFREDSRQPHKFYVGRRLVGVFRRAGLVDLVVRSFASTRTAPLDASSRSFLGEYLRDLAERVTTRLGPAVLSGFRRLVDPDSPNCLLDDPDLHMIVVDHMIQGRLPRQVCLAESRDLSPV